VLGAQIFREPLRQIPLTLSDCRVLDAGFAVVVFGTCVSWIVVLLDTLPHSGGGKILVVNSGGGVNPLSLANPGAFVTRVAGVAAQPLALIG
jgi:hypothetical protein